MIKIQEKQMNKIKLIKMKENNGLSNRNEI